MYVYVDESGDPGMHGRPGTSEHFVIALVLIENEAAAEQCRRQIRELRHDLGWKSNREFKFNRCSRSIRQRFLASIADCSFGYSAFVLNKARLVGPGFQHKRSLYKYTTSLAFSNVGGQFDDAIVIFDRCGDRDFRRTMQSYLRRKTRTSGKSPIRHVTAKDSRHEDVLQMADMIAGAIARWYKPKEDRRAYRSLISHREIRVQFWPS